MAFKCMAGLSPEYLSNKFISRGSISGRATRNSQKLNIPSVNQQLARGLFIIVS